MKKTFTLIALLFFGLTVLAYDQTILSINSTSNNAVRIVIDGRSYADYNNSRNDLTIRDLRPGYHSVKIYQQKSYRKGNGNQNNRWGNTMRLIYESRIYIKPNYHVDMMVNRFGKVFIDERVLTGGYSDDDYGYNDNDWNNNYHYPQAMDATGFSQLKQTIRNEGFDNTRLSIAKQAANQQYFTSAQVKELVGLFSFEDSKLDFAKHCYRRAIDKENYFIINDAFSFSSSKESWLSLWQQAGKCCFLVAILWKGWNGGSALFL